MFFIRFVMATHKATSLAKARMTQEPIYSGNRLTATSVYNLTGLLQTYAGRLKAEQRQAGLPVQARWLFCIWAVFAGDGGSSVSVIELVLDHR
jgi:hypothetical protein